MSSADEEEIRVAVVARLRELMPTARIVHELNVAGQGTNRIDVAAIGAQALVGVEIKSRKDTLKRLGDQWDAFSKCCHHVIVAAHEKHFVEHRYKSQRADVPGELRLNHPGFFEGYSRLNRVWRFPRPDRDRYGGPSWSFDPFRQCRVQPRAHSVLQILWAEELRAECSRHGLASGSRRTRGEMIVDMVWMMTGREICEAVCRQLRQRPFARADEAIGAAPKTSTAHAPELSL